MPDQHHQDRNPAQAVKLGYALILKPACRILPRGLYAGNPAASHGVVTIKHFIAVCFRI
jgi:hypothetical protein